MNYKENTSSNPSAPGQEVTIDSMSSSYSHADLLYQVEFRYRITGFLLLFVPNALNYSLPSSLQAPMVCTTQTSRFVSENLIAILSFNNLGLFHYNKTCNEQIKTEELSKVRAEFKN